MTGVAALALPSAPPWVLLPVAPKSGAALNAAVTAWGFPRPEPAVKGSEPGTQLAGRWPVKSPARSPRPLFLA